MVLVPAEPDAPIAEGAVPHPEVVREVERIRQ